MLYFPFLQQTSCKHVCMGLCSQLLSPGSVPTAPGCLGEGTCPAATRPSPRRAGTLPGCGAGRRAGSRGSSAPRAPHPQPGTGVFHRGSEGCSRLVRGARLLARGWCRQMAVPGAPKPPAPAGGTMLDGMVPKASRQHRQVTLLHPGKGFLRCPPRGPSPDGSSTATAGAG